MNETATIDADTTAPASPAPRFREPDRVARGAGFLDGHFPGWTRRVTLARLRIGHNTDCLLGQLFGAYDEAKTRTLAPMLPGNTDMDVWAYEHGFIGGTVHLRQAWVTEVNARRAARAMQATR